MHIFDYDKAPESLLSPEITSLIAEIHEYKGRQDFLLNAKAEVLDALVEVSRAKSVASSNRIEGVSTPDYRLKDLFDDDASPRNKEELAICAYRECFTSLLKNYEMLPPTPETILNLHRNLYKQLPTNNGGSWKNEDSAITEIDGEGRESVRFRTVAAEETPIAMSLLCDAYNKAMEQKRFNPLLLSVMFVFDFLCIHPFQDGNGRMSRLLALLLTCRSGYMVGKYVHKWQYLMGQQRSEGDHGVQQRRKANDTTPVSSRRRKGKSPGAEEIVYRGAAKATRNTKCLRHRPSRYVRQRHCVRTSDTYQWLALKRRLFSTNSAKVTGS